MYVIENFQLDPFWHNVRVVLLLLHAGEMLHAGGS